MLICSLAGSVFSANQQLHPLLSNLGAELTEVDCREPISTQLPPWFAGANAVVFGPKPQAPGLIIVIHGFQFSV